MTRPLRLARGDLRRWERVAARPLLQRAADGARLAFTMGALLSVLATVVALLQADGTHVRLRSGESVALWAVLASYLLAGPLTGALFGALFPLTRSAPGAAVVGALAVAPVVAVVCSGVSGRPPGVWTAGDYLFAVVMLAALGMPGGLIVRHVATT